MKLISKAAAMVVAVLAGLLTIEARLKPGSHKNIPILAFALVATHQ